MIIVKIAYKPNFIWITHPSKVKILYKRYLIIGKYFYEIDSTNDYDDVF